MSDQPAPANRRGRPNQSPERERRVVLDPVLALGAPKNAADTLITCSA